MRLLTIVLFVCVGVFTGFAQEVDASLTASAETPYDYKDISTTTNYVGIGVVVQKDIQSTWMYVRKVMRHGPAQEAGLQKGDFITKVNDKPTMKMELEDLAEVLIGPEGTTVELVVMRDHKFFTMTVERAAISF